MRRSDEAMRPWAVSAVRFAAYWAGQATDAGAADAKLGGRAEGAEAVQREESIGGAGGWVKGRGRGEGGALGGRATWGHFY